MELTSIDRVMQNLKAIMDYDLNEYINVPMKHNFKTLPECIITFKERMNQEIEKGKKFLKKIYNEPTEE